MKTVALVLCFAVAYVQCTGYWENQKFRQNQRECFTENKVDRKISDRILYWNDWKVVDSSLNDWAHCVLVKAGLLSKDDVFGVEPALDNLPDNDRNDVIDLIDNCLKELKETQELPWYFTKCYQTSSPKHSIF